MGTPGAGVLAPLPIGARPLSIIGVSTSQYTAKGAASDGPRPPSAPGVSAAEGAGPGEIAINVLTLPSSWGDLSAYNDGLGTAGSLAWWNEVDGWQTLVAPAATGIRNVTIPAELWSEEMFAVRVAGVSAAGRRGRSLGIFLTGQPGGQSITTPDDGITPDDGTTA